MLAVDLVERPVRHRYLWVILNSSAGRAQLRKDYGKSADDCVIGGA
jgi:hypothetical protein